ncbi:MULTISPECIES: crotonase/enoyl-CoA hydratase family protein [Gammaproteobacteria]|uniref:Crotonase/enoyl-CoA hydratase family protein n=1 Tax=Vreelandella halophila TaxID=86177 RepID=A0A9X4YDG7_9GAMM|nr:MULTISPECIES: crotonase/enoyl-CoA hydratase family protein [Gammaproteobacteria]KAA8982508.1 crotonase/enoyl-CoA hydratase family protein [Halospina sp. K52047b]MYL27679.1 crotonase/enoyl-CoA hydratase family protein [Halomonas utahensis]MYL75409.1 crotonase/enoyl-CoA hydratase family protein [Halomonas sp. 22501_18_FS]
MTRTVTVEKDGALHLIRIERPHVRNAVDGPTADALADAFRAFEKDEQARVAVLSGAGEHFCAGADLKAVASGDGRNRLSPEGDGPMGPTRMRLTKPVIAAVSGYCVAGGLELAAWCDLRVADETAVFGVFCRRFGVPLIDGGTVRLPRLIGQSHAMDMILTGRDVAADEGQRMGLVNRLVPTGQAIARAVELARQLAGHPWTCLREDRLSALEQWGMCETEAIANEFTHGQRTLSSGETVSGAARFRDGQGRHGGAE